MYICTFSVPCAVAIFKNHARTVVDLKKLLAIAIQIHW